MAIKINVEVEVFRPEEFDLPGTECLQNEGRTLLVRILIGPSHRTNAVGSELCWIRGMRTNLLNGLFRSLQVLRFLDVC